MGRIADVCRMACDLQEGVLESAARAEERSTLLTCVPDRAQRTGRAAVWTRGHTPECVEGIEQGDGRVGHAVGIDPAAGHVEPRALAGQLQRAGNRLVRDHRRVVVANECYVDLS